MDDKADGVTIDKAEKQMKHTHRCLNCKMKFKALKPGCPICGPSTKIEPIKSAPSSFLCAKGID